MMPYDRPPGHDPEDGPPVLSLRGGAEESDRDRDQQRRTIRGGRAILPAERRAGRRVSRLERRSPMRSATPSSSVNARPASAETPPTSAPRPPAKRQKDAIDLSSSPKAQDSDTDGDIVSKPRVKRGKPSSSAPSRNRVSLRDLTVIQQDPFNVPSSGGAPEEEKLDFPTNMIYHNFDRHNRDKVMTAISGMKVELSNDLVSPRRQGIQQSIDMLISLPIIHNYTPVVKHHQKHLALDIKRHPTVWQLIAKDSTQSNVLMITNLPQEEYSEEEAKAVCKVLVEIINRWPASLGLLTKPATGFKSGTGHARLLTLACRHRELPNKPIICTLPLFKAATPGVPGVQGENHFKLWQSCIEPTTYKQRNDAKRASARIMTPDCSVPEMSDRYQFVSYDTRGGLKEIINKVSPGPGQPPSFASFLPSEEDLQISQEERDGLLNAERLLRLYSATLTNQGLVINLEGCKNIWTSLLEKYGARVGGQGASRGIFGGSDLLQVYPQFASLRTVITPGVTLENRLREIDASYRLPHIIVRSTNRAWLIPVEEIISDTWLLEGDILQAWTRGAEAADQANASIRNGDRPPSSCMCDQEMAQVQSHPCAQCGVLRLCNELAESEFDGRRVCRSCMAKIQQRPSGSYAMEYLHGLMRNRLYLEQQYSQGLITDDEKALMMGRCLDAIKAMMPNRDDAEHANLTYGTAWRDGYSGKLHSVPVDNTASTRTEPDRPSIDAIFPQWPTEFGYRMHCPGNLAITLQAINYMKAIQIPAFLAMVCWYEHERMKIEAKFDPNIWGAEAREELNLLETQMVKISKRLRIIRLTFGWTRRRRLNAKITNKRQFEVALAPLISGQPQPELRGSMERLDTHHNFTASAPELEYPEYELARIRTLVQEIQDFFEVQLPTGEDGCPYFAHPESIPQVWNWRIAFWLSNERLIRMKYQCNRYWPTYETVETIFLECIFQVCVIRCAIKSSDEYYDLKRHLRAKYASILGLPITLAYHDGLTFAIGHDRHGEAMVTGWPIKPSRLDERLDGDPSNNVRIEPRSENFLKADYATSTYPSLKKMVMEVDLPKEVYDTSLKPQPLSEDELRELEWNGEDVEGLFEEISELFDPVSAPVTGPEVGEDSKPETGVAKQNPTAQVPTLRRKSSKVDHPESGLSRGFDARWTQPMDVPENVNPGTGSSAMRRRPSKISHPEGGSSSSFGLPGAQWTQPIAIPEASENVKPDAGTIRSSPTTKKLTMRVKSDETDYSGGQSVGELEDQWAQAMASTTSANPSASFQATSRNPSLGTNYSDEDAADTMESIWSQSIQSTMQSQYDEIMRLVESRPPLDRGLQDLLLNLGQAKDSNDDVSFMAILTVIRAELS